MTGQTENSMRSGSSRSRGAYGEQLAAACLKREGYEVLRRNYRCCFGEIDLIALEADVLCFVEVKLRSGLDFGLPSEAVDHRKQARILRTAEHWLSEQYAASAQLPHIRFDVLELLEERSVGGTVRYRKYRLLRDAFSRNENNEGIRKRFP